jgi:hypothetical protein
MRFGQPPPRKRTTEALCQRSRLVTVTKFKWKQRHHVITCTRMGAPRF